MSHHASSLKGKVCLVTGASRGIGRGIAIQLGQCGATVYVTGRPPKQSAAELTEEERAKMPTLEDVAKEVTEAGGQGRAVYCDHSDAKQVEKLFEVINAEQNEQLDILINNAYAAVSTLAEDMETPFWVRDPSHWDFVNNVGLRNHYICAVHAARLMVPRKQGIIINISSIGGLRYMFNVAYGVGKAACDRMAADMAVELKPHNIAAVSVWPGPVRTEAVQSSVGEKLRARDDVHVGGRVVEDMMAIWEAGESTQFTGKCIARYAADDNYMAKTGRILLSGDLADEYDVVDIDGRRPQFNGRSLRDYMIVNGWKRLAEWIPAWMKYPAFMLALEANKWS